MLILTLAYVVTTFRLLSAVKKQAEIAMSGDRAWLWEYDSFSFYDTNPRLVGCSVGFVNWGKSPAWIASVAGGYQFISDPKELSQKPHYEEIEWRHTTVSPVGAGENQTFIVTHRIGGERKKESRLAVFVRIEYRDRFNLAETEKPRVLRYCFITDEGIGPMWRKAGPRGYNEYT